MENERSEKTRVSSMLTSEGNVDVHQYLLYIYIYNIAPLSEGR